MDHVGSPGGHLRFHRNCIGPTASARTPTVAAWTARTAWTSWTPRAAGSTWPTGPAGSAWTNDLRPGPDDGDHYRRACPGAHRHSGHRCIGARRQDYRQSRLDRQPRRDGSVLVQSRRTHLLMRLQSMPPSGIRSRSLRLAGIPDSTMNHQRHRPRHSWQRRGGEGGGKGPPVSRGDPRDSPRSSLI
jgi:hypothetical protein